MAKKDDVVGTIRSNLATAWRQIAPDVEQIIREHKTMVGTCGFDGKPFTLGWEGQELWLNHPESTKDERVGVNLADPFVALIVIAAKCYSVKVKSACIFCQEEALSGEHSCQGFHNWLVVGAAQARKQFLKAGFNEADLKEVWEKQ